MNHAVLLLWHKDMKQLIRLLDCFSDSSFFFYIHMDKKSKVSEQDIIRLRNMQQVKGIYRKYRIYWGGFNILKAELFLLQEILKGGRYNYVHFMSGQDYPIKNVDYINHFFEMHKGLEFIEYMPLPSQKWEHGTFHRFAYFRLNNLLDCRTPVGAWIADCAIYVQKLIGYRRCVPNQFEQLYGGSNWISITGDCARYVIHNRKQQRTFYNRLKYTFAPDETFFHTVILNSPFRQNVQNDNLRYILWGEHAPSPFVLNVAFWESIVTSDCLFARKVESGISDTLLNMVDKHLLKHRGL